MRKMVWRGMVLFLAATRVGYAQEYAGPVWGGNGGTTTYNLDCGSAGVMVGVYGRAGIWIDQVGVTCRIVKADGSLGSTYTRGPTGGNGGTPSEPRCPDNQVVSGISSRAGSYLHAMAVACTVWVPSTRRFDARLGGLFRYLSGTAIGGTNNPLVHCPSDKVGKALRGKSGGYVDSMQFVCDGYNK